MSVGLNRLTSFLNSAILLGVLIVVALRGSIVQEILGVERRRKWDDETKAAIVAESFRSECSVSLVARRHGVSPSQLFSWREAAREKIGDEVDVAASFLPVAVDGVAAPQVTHAAAPT